MLAVITFCGAWLRISHLGNKSLWLDEGATVALARASWQHFAWVWWHGEANLQTIYFLLMRGWIHLGSSEPFLRLPSAIFGIVTIPALYSAARKFTGVWESLAAAALLAFSPSAVYYSQEARGYTLATLLVLASTYFFVRAVDGGRRRDWVLWTLCGMVAFYCHDFTALVLVAEVVSLLFKAPPVPWRKVILGGAIIFVAAVPGLTYVFRASPENLHFVWMPAPSLKESWHLAMFFGGSGLKVALSLVLWIAGLMAVIRARRNGAVDDYWRGMLLVTVGCRACNAAGADFAAAADVPAALRVLLAAGGMHAGSDRRRNVVEMAAGIRARAGAVYRRRSLGGEELLPSPRRLARREPSGAQLRKSGRCGGLFPVLHASDA